MDVSFKPEYEDFRKEVIEFLDSELFVPKLWNPLFWINKSALSKKLLSSVIYQAIPAKRLSIWNNISGILEACLKTYNINTVS